jgi:EAL domain-containing protein (putative c-di-GMP-specific phosphodiesterase class I)
METGKTRMRGDLFAHISKQPDNTFVGAWSVFMLRSAFQPIFGFCGGKLKMVAFEGLLRPTRGNQLLAPGEFFAKVPADQRMHVETLARTVHLLNAGRFLDPSAMIFINFDPAVFVDRSLTDKALRDLRLVLHEAGNRPHAHCV